MTDDHLFFREILESGRHRPCGRAIVFDRSRRRILVMRNLGAREKYVAFPGGGIELGETLEECLIRELDEEIAAKVLDFEFLFLVENFIPFEGEFVHGIELYCEIRLESDAVVSQLDGFEFPWIELDELSGTDLRPTVVRDRIMDGTFRELRHLVTRG